MGAMQSDGKRVPPVTQAPESVEGRRAPTGDRSRSMPPLTGALRDAGSCVPTLDRTSPIPLHAQLHDHLRKQISAGAIPEGSVLPTVREIMTQTSTSLATVQRAIRDLQGEGLVQGGRGRPLRVCAGTPTPRRVARTQEISFDHWDMNVDARRRLANLFGSRHPGVRIVERAVDADFISVSAERPRALMDDLADLSGPLREMTGRDPESDTLLGSFRAGGRIAIIPTGPNTAAVLYNRDLLEGAGEALPHEGWTWEDYLACGRRVSERLSGARGFVTDASISKFGPVLWSMGGSFLTTDGSRCTLGEDVAVEAGELFRRLVGPSPDASSSQAMITGTVGAFQESRAAFLFAGAGGCALIRRRATFRFGALPPPGGVSYRMLVGFGLRAAAADSALHRDFAEAILLTAHRPYLEEPSPLSLRPDHGDDEVNRVFARTFATARTLFDELPPGLLTRRFDSVVALVDRGVRRMAGSDRPVREMMRELAADVDFAIQEDAHGRM